MTDLLPGSFDILPHLIALAIAYLLALPIGWNREKAERSAGLRTFPLVAVATCGFIQATESLTRGEPEATARIVEGLIVGHGVHRRRRDPAPRSFGAGHGDRREPVGDRRDGPFGRAGQL